MSDVALVQLMSADDAASLREDVLALARDFGLDVNQPPGGPGATRGDRLEYRVVTGGVIAAVMPALSSVLYQLALSRAPFPARPSDHVDSAVNVNVLSGRGAFYQWHKDHENYTGVLFLDSREPGTGGALEVIVPGDGDRADVTQSFFPAAGGMLVLPGATYEHRVSPLEDDQARVTVLFVLRPRDSKPAPRADVDNYIFGGAGGR